MKLIIESTQKIVTLDTGAGQIPARVWEGHTDSGIPVHCFITRVAVADNLPSEQFERELQQQQAPSAEIQAIPLHLIL
jgi:hypothetical protein